MSIIDCLNPKIRIEYFPPRGVDITGEFDYRKCVEYKLCTSRDLDFSLYVYRNNPDVKRVDVIPCGQCIACRIHHAKEWQCRIIAESKYHEHMYFLTLTYDDDHLPLAYDKDGMPHSTLRKDDIQRFFKRLRRRVDHDLRYVCAGEYGATYFRPHYHVILFGLPLTDLIQVAKSDKGYPLFKSEFLTDVWSNGMCDVAAFSSSTAGYVAQYCVSKYSGSDAKRFYDLMQIEPEFLLSSRRPGIGQQYVIDHADKLAHDGYVIFSTESGGKQYVLPRSWRKWLIDNGYRIEIEDASLDSMVTNLERNVVALQEANDSGTSLERRIKDRYAAVVAQINYHKN